MAPVPAYAHIGGKQTLSANATETSPRGTSPRSVLVHEPRQAVAPLNLKMAHGGGLRFELLDHRRFPTQAEAPMPIFEYIEGWYNTKRRHSCLGYQSPLAFERSYQQAA